MSGKRAFVLMAFMLALFTSCAGSESGERSRYQAPGYARMVDDGNFEVVCGTSRITVMRSSVEDFRNADGTDKTREEFCTANQSDTRIGR